MTTSLREAWASLPSRLKLLEPVAFSDAQWSLLERLHRDFNDREAHTRLPLAIARFRDEVAVDEASFHHRLLADHGTYVGPGHWFELDDRSFRLGFGWPTHDELRAGLDALLLAAGDAAR